MYGGAPRFIYGLAGNEINLEYNDTTTIEDIKRQFIIHQRQHSPFRYWFLISIVKDSNHIYDNNIKLVDLLDQDIDTTFNFVICDYDDYDIRLLDLIDNNFDSFKGEILRSRLSDNLLNNISFLLFLIQKYKLFIFEFFKKIPEIYKNDRLFILEAA
jgi:hypothetical protein